MNELLTNGTPKRGSKKEAITASASLLLLHWLCWSLCVDHNKVWEIHQENELPASREICMQVRKQQLELDMEQRTGSK